MWDIVSDVQEVSKDVFMLVGIKCGCALPRYMEYIVHNSVIDIELCYYLDEYPSKINGIVKTYKLNHKYSYSIDIWGDSLSTVLKECP